MKKLNVTLLGTGLMGVRMAQNICKGGARIKVWNRTLSKAEPLAAHGAKAAALRIERVANRAGTAEHIIGGASARADCVALAEQRVGRARRGASVLANVVTHRAEELAALGGCVDGLLAARKFLLEVVQNFAMPLQFVHRRGRAARRIHCLTRHAIIHLAELLQERLNVLHECCRGGAIGAAELRELRVALRLKPSRSRARVASGGGRRGHDFL